MKHIPYRRSDNPQDEPQDKNHGDQQSGSDKIKSSDLVGRRYEMKRKDKIDERLRPTDPHQKRPKQMPHRSDYAKHYADKDFIRFHHSDPPSTSATDRFLLITEAWQS
jgi:hypothetical protein